MARHSPQTIERFPTTSWTLVGQAGAGLDEQGRRALNDLLQRYLPALKSHLMRKFHLHTHDADDLLQEFVSHKILERDLVGRAESARGRFRTLLATSLDRYALNELQRRQAQKRKPDRAGSLDRDEYRQLATDGTSPEQTLEVAWAQEVLAQTLTRMRDECRRLQRNDLWHVFEARIVSPLLRGGEPAEYSELVERFGFVSPAQACNALKTAKRMFSRHLQNVLAEYATGARELEEELRDLGQALTGRRH